MNKWEKILSDSEDWSVPSSAIKPLYKDPMRKVRLIIEALLLISFVILIAQDCRRNITCEAVWIEVDTVTTRSYTLYYDDSVDHFIIKPK